MRMIGNRSYVKIIPSRRDAWHTNITVQGCCLVGIRTRFSVLVKNGLFAKRANVR